MVAWSRAESCRCENKTDQTAQLGGYSGEVPDPQLYASAAVKPATGRDFCLFLPAVSTAAMSEFLRRFSATLAQDEHVVMVLDRAGWHTSHDLVVPSILRLLRTH